MCVCVSNIWKSPTVSVIFKSYVLFISYRLAFVIGNFRMYIFLACDPPLAPPPTHAVILDLLQHAVHQFARVFERAQHLLGVVQPFRVHLQHRVEITHIF